jgi:choloylglycine hydrolase
MKLILLVLVPLLLTVHSESCFSCTSFKLDTTSGPLIGKSYDWDFGDGLVILNKRDVSKKSVLLNPFSRRLTWRSTYASVTFNQYGWEFPNGGMNEKGLVVEVLWLGDTIVPPFDLRPATNEVQIVQYALDYFATTAEFLNDLPRFRVANIMGELHYFVCDAGGACAVVEYLDGQLKIASGAKVVTNDTQEDSLKYLKKFVGFGGNLPIPTDQESLSRFVRVSHDLKQYNGGLPAIAVDNAFNILNRVNYKLEIQTFWQIVYDPKNLKVYFKAEPTDALMTYDFKLDNLSCREPVMAYDLSLHRSGELANHLRPMTIKRNEALLKSVFDQSDSFLLTRVKNKLSKYPLSTSCQVTSKGSSRLKPYIDNHSKHSDKKK